MGGKTVLPGFVDAHGHVLDLGFRAMSLDLSGDQVAGGGAGRRSAPMPRPIPTRAGSAAAAGTRKFGGSGGFRPQPNWTRRSRDRPVWLARADGHAGWANSAALRAAGVTAKSIAPAGGRIEKDAAGSPSGRVRRCRAGLIDKAAPSPLPIEYDVALRKAQDILLADGITATADMGTDYDAWFAMRRLGDVGGLRVRIMSYARGVEVASHLAGGRARRRGCTATGCGWAASSCSPTARSVRAARC